MTLSTHQYIALNVNKNIYFVCTECKSDMAIAVVVAGVRPAATAHTVRALHTVGLPVLHERILHDVWRLSL